MRSIEGLADFGGRADGRVAWLSGRVDDMGGKGTDAHVPVDVRERIACDGPALMSSRGLAASAPAMLN